MENLLCQPGISAAIYKGENTPLTEQTKEVDKKKTGEEVACPCLHLDDSGQPKVGNLHVVVLPDQDVACRQVAVDVVLWLQVGHAAGDLSTNVDQLWQFQHTSFTCRG